MDGTVPKIFYNFYLNFMNFLIFLNSRGPGSKFQISSGGQTFGQGGAGPLAPPPPPPPPPPAATPLLSPLYNESKNDNETSKIFHTKDKY